MRSLILLVAVIIQSFALVATAAPSQKTVDEWLTFSLKLAANSFAKDGAFRCEGLAGTGISSKGFAHTAELAQTAYLLQCLQEKCGSLNDTLLAGEIRMLALKEQEQIDYMHSNDFSQEEIQAAVAKIRNAKPHQGTITCTNASPLARSFVFDSCFSMPLQCQPNR